ncbi:MAG TPA: FAD/NAD(P)-binding protein [Solirubrobacteraceae bacterium]|nr:FAD/NAD(P)-binding protein [Solirubrobacteraceae bacterium]
MPLAPEFPAEAPGAMVPAPFVITARRQETADTWTLELAPRAGTRLAFSPGQFAMLSAYGAGEVPISISGDPDGGGALIHTVRAVGLATQAICRARRGEVLGVRGPFGRPWPVAQVEGADVLVIAGGIGLAPLRPAILTLLARRERYGRLSLLYGGRSPTQLLYTAELEEWAARGLEVALTVDSAGPEWLGRVGVVPRLVARAGFDPARTAAFVCGPEVMMRFTVVALAKAGVTSERVYAAMERNMQCGVALCGHCQLGPTLVCRDGPVYRWSELERWLTIREL